jgi:alpha-tubulin suppressor-like RCC1 family protein
MSPRFQRIGLRRRSSSLSRVGPACVALVVCLAAASCGGDKTPTGNPPLRLSSIIIDGGSRTLERGTKQTLTAVARDTGGKVATVPFAWRSTVDSIVTMGPDGRLVAGDTGLAVVTASALGIISSGITVHVVWQGPAKVAAFQFNPPVALTPDGQLADSIRVVVTNTDGNPVVAMVRFAVTAGGGAVTPAAPALVKVGQSGWASATWRLGPVAGTNTVTATVVDADSLPVAWVANNPVSFTVTSYAALAVVQGNNQTGSILSPLPVTPSIRLVDADGKPRAAIPISFTATGNGRVANAVASTAADGTASPGVWTLGDATGDQQLVVTVEGAKLALHATATGTSVRYSTARVATAETATCSVTADQFASCLGRAPQIGTGDTSSRSVPTLTAGGVHFSSLTGNGAHFCGINVDLAIYCWGISAYVDTTGVTISAASPTRLQSNIAWLQVSPGGQHNCAVANDHSAYCWGENTSGQLGDNGVIRHPAPQPVFGGFKFSAVASGGSHSCGIILDATALCWGSNSSGQLGDGSSTNRLSPTAVSGALHWKSLGAGSSFTCGLAQDGTAYCWGAGTGRATPGSYTGAPVFTSMSVGAAHVCALQSDGTAYCWGDNSSGQLGDGTITSRSTPTQVASTFRFASISAGFQHTCGVTTDGFLACWGRNTVGEIGVGVPLLQLTPRYVVVGVTP